MRQGAKEQKHEHLENFFRHQAPGWDISRGRLGTRHVSRVTCLASEVVSVHQGRVSSVPDIDVVTVVEKIILLPHSSRIKVF